MSRKRCRRGLLACHELSRGNQEVEILTDIDGRVHLKQRGNLLLTSERASASLNGWVFIYPLQQEPHGTRPSNVLAGLGGLKLSCQCHRMFLVIAHVPRGHQPSPHAITELTLLRSSTLPWEGIAQRILVSATPPMRMAFSNCPSFDWPTSYCTIMETLGDVQDHRGP